MRTTTLGKLTVHLTGGDDREGGGNGPLVVLLHGFGAPGTDLVPLWRELRPPPGTRFAFPEAPLALDPYGDARAWWMIDMAKLEAALAGGELRDLTRDVPEGMAEARALISGLLDQLDAPQVVLGGFSQGAMLALDVALCTDRPLAGLALMSGTLLAEHEWLPLMPKRKGLCVVQSHGRLDPLLPFSIAERLRDELTSAGLEVTFVPFNGGHEIGGSVIDALDGLLNASLAP
ncbi:MAG: hypothetical protein HYZ29_11655 [Myxococcales bacterium]|nr:hypothetical protein [Myxococcales bacterium]